MYETQTYSKSESTSCMSTEFVILQFPFSNKKPNLKLKPSNFFNEDYEWNLEPTNSFCWLKSNVMS